MPENGVFFKKPPNITQRTDYIVDDVFKRNRQIMPAGYEGEGKSIVNHVLFYCIAYEAPFADIFPVTGGNVMLIDSENEWDILRDRTARITKGLEMDGYTKKHRIWWEPNPHFLLEDDSTWQPIMTIIDDVKPIIISLDHLARFHLLDENIAKEMGKANKGLIALKRRQESSIYVNHHFNKKDIKGSFRMRLRGSSSLLANTDIAFEVRTLSRKRVGEKIFLEKIGLIFQPRKEPTPAPIILKIEEGKDYMKLHYEGDFNPVDDPRMDDLAHKFYHEVFLLKGGEWTINEINKQVQGYADISEIRKCLHFIEDKLDLISSTRKGSVGGEFRYSLNNPTGAKAMICPWCKEKVMV